MRSRAVRWRRSAALHPRTRTPPGGLLVGFLWYRPGLFSAGFGECPVGPKSPDLLPAKAVLLPSQPAAQLLTISPGGAWVAGESNAGEMWRRPWLEQLPGVTTPPFSFSHAELHQIDDRATLRQALEMRRMADECFALLEAHLRGLGHDEAAFLWALSICHSRCFRFRQGGGSIQHLMVPGVDMANHAFFANAGVRYVVEPSQGLAAAAEVSEVGAQVRRPPHALPFS